MPYKNIHWYIICFYTLTVITPGIPSHNNMCAKTTQIHCSPWSFQGNVCFLNTRYWAEPHTHFLVGPFVGQGIARPLLSNSWNDLLTWNTFRLADMHTQLVFLAEMSLPHSHPIFPVKNNLALHAITLIQVNNASPSLTWHSLSVHSPLWHPQSLFPLPAH